MECSRGRRAFSRPSGLAGEGSGRLQSILRRWSWRTPADLAARRKACRVRNTPPPFKLQRQSPGEGCSFCSLPWNCIRPGQPDSCSRQRLLSPQAMNAQHRLEVQECQPACRAPHPARASSAASPAAPVARGPRWGSRRSVDGPFTRWGTTNRNRPISDHRHRPPASRPCTTDAASL